MNIFPNASPIEKLFWEKAKPLIPDLEREVQLGEYRVDFFVRNSKLVIELDGHDYHKTKEQRTRDAQQMRYLLGLGYHTIRYTGTEIFNNADACISGAITFIKQFSIDIPSQDIELKYGRLMTEREIDKYEIDESLTDEDVQDWGYKDLEDFWDCNDPD